MGILNFYLGIGSLELSIASLLSFMTRSHNISSFLDLDGKPCLMTYGEVPWLLQKWEIPSLGASLSSSLLNGLF